MSLRLAAAALSLCPALLLAAPIYKWVDKDGVTHYSAEPPSKEARPANLPEIQTYKSNPRTAAPVNVLDANSTPTLVAPNAGAAAAPVALKASIASPKPDEVFRDPEGRIPVAVEVEPGLPAGHGIMVYVDGVRRTPRPWMAPSYALEGLERGSHNVEVAVVTADGKEQARTKAVTFHLLPARAQK